MVMRANPGRNFGDWPATRQRTMRAKATKLRVYGGIAEYIMGIA